MNVKGLRKLISTIATKRVKKSTLLIWGPTGAGKTTVCKQLASDMGYEFVSFSCETLTDPADLRGGIVNVSSGDGFTMRYSVPELVEQLRSRKTLMLFDELVRTPPQSQAALMSVFTDEKRLGLHALPEDTLIIAAANPVGDDYFGNELDLAQAERFLHISYAPDREEVLDYLEESGAHPGILGYYRQVPDAMYAPMLALPYKPKSPPRAIEALAEIVEALSDKDFDDLGHEIAEGLIGEHAAGIIQSIRNALETPLSLTQMLDGSGVKKLKGWQKKSVKITLFRESLRNLEKGMTRKDPEFTKFEDQICKEEGLPLLDKFAETLTLFPVDLLRKHIEKIRSNAITLFGELVQQRYHPTKPTGHDNIVKFVDLVQELKREDEKLCNS